MNQLIKAIEALRIVGVCVGFYLGYAYLSQPALALTLFMAFVVFSLSGLTGIEGLFFSKATSQSLGRESSPYQKQSAVNNLAIAITAFIVLVFHWGKYAELAVLFVSLIFIILSSCIHAWEIFADQNNNTKNKMRPVLTIILVIASIPLIYRFLV